MQRYHWNLAIAALSGAALLGGCSSSDGIERSTPCSDFTDRYDIDDDGDLAEAVDALAEMNGGSISVADASTVFVNCQSNPEDTVGDALDRGSILTGS